MGLFSKKIGPVFLKETSDAAIFIERMQVLQDKATGEVKQKIEKQLNLAKYGEVGENNIAFELSNSGMDMYILHDICLEINGLSAQIDYIVVTRQHIYVIECKNLIGNIEIDSTGAFIRTYELSGKRIKEGIYSPITQNQRHLQVLKEVRKAAKTNFISKMLFEKSFDALYLPIVVLANPKTYLNAKYARKDIKDKVLRADQLVAYIEKTDAKEAQKSKGISTEEMRELAEFFLSNNKADRSDYAQKYEELLTEVEIDGSESDNIKKEREEEEKEKPQQANFKDNVDRNEMVRKLKAFRLEQSRKENVKPYYIFKDAQMNDLIDKMPKNKEELLQIQGFGSVKVEKYGDAILTILDS